MIGQALLHFKITAKLGEGGMGEVCRAENTELGHEVAIPPGVYPNQPDPISTVAVKSMLVASRSVEPELATRILKTLFDNIPNLIAHHPRAADISLETAQRRRTACRSTYTQGPSPSRRVNG